MMKLIAKARCGAGRSVIAFSVVFSDDLRTKHLLTLLYLCKLSNGGLIPPLTVAHAAKPARWWRDASWSRRGNGIGQLVCGGDVWKWQFIAFN